ncbi:hypothetical protein [Streptomyces niveus]|uniref:hypothetical protein n=1 Tax=Streptomyces niveus TaxID=193462 RepID=UPI0033DB53F6
MRLDFGSRLAAVAITAVTAVVTVGQTASAAPANGDVNPYGTALVDKSTGQLRRGDVLVSNFNNAANLQGTGTTLVQISPKGETRLFAQINPKKLPGPCPGGVGLTTALSILPGGWVVVGSLPTADGRSATAKAGCLIVLDKHGKVRETISGKGINGPWDMTAKSHGDKTELFVTNVLNGTVAGGGDVVRRGTVLRITLHRVTAIPDALKRDNSAGPGRVVTTNEHLNGPLGLAIAPNGHILTVNAGDGNIVETAPRGHQVAVRTLDSSGTPPGAGALFGLAVAENPDRVYFVDDATNTLNLLSRH